jgi:hypothetical protein
MPDTGEARASMHPIALRDWSGNQSGGVRRLFDSTSGRPTGEVMKTHLLSRLQSWARSLVDTPDTAPRVILLVGGPGNGKTEAIESTVQWMDEALRCDGLLSATLRNQLLPANPHRAGRFGGGRASTVAGSPARAGA